MPGSVPIVHPTTSRGRPDQVRLRLTSQQGRRSLLGSQVDRCQGCVGGGEGLEDIEILGDAGSRDLKVLERVVSRCLALGVLLVPQLSVFYSG